MSFWQALRKAWSSSSQPAKRTLLREAPSTDPWRSYGASRAQAQEINGPSKLNTENWGIVNIHKPVMLANGHEYKAFAGFLKVVTDKHWEVDEGTGEFRSAAQWSVQIFASEDTSELPVFTVPGCTIRFFELFPSSDRMQLCHDCICDARIYRRSRSSSRNGFAAAIL